MQSDDILRGEQMTSRGLGGRAIVIAIAGTMALTGGAAYGKAPADRPEQTKKVKPPDRRVTHAERKAAAKRAKEGGLQLLVAGEAAMAAGGEAPHYFSVANYANSPLPMLAAGTVGNERLERTTPTDGASNVFVINPEPVGAAGSLTGFETYVMPASGPHEFHAYVLRPTGAPDAYSVVFDSGPLTVPAVDGGAVLSFPVAPFAVQPGDRIAHYGQGIPIEIGAGTDQVLYPADLLPAQGATFTVGVDYPVFVQPRTYSIAAKVETVSGGIRKFVNGLPGLGEAGANDLGQYIPLAEPDRTTYPGSDYYEIGLVQYREQMHSDLPPTLLRGYVQLSTTAVPGKQVPLDGANLDGTTTPLLVLGVDKPHYLGPAIVATKDRPVRIKFRNLLPAGEGGNLFLPVDTTVMGSGMGPGMGGMAEMDPQNPMCGMTPKPADCYTENRATLHLHGGITPWISDGTPHQWVTPAEEQTPYPQGVSVHNVPDMPDPGPGAMTFFYTNKQSARLMFYHDHAWGITRLNVYAGEAAAYLIRDEKERQLLDAGVIPGDELPLVVQDKTFVPSEAQLAASDPSWDIARWGGTGNLWVPHVYVPAQNPGDSSGVNQFGRWAYGPWFWPPTLVEHMPVQNPYFVADCDPDGDGIPWCEPPEIPGVPYLSMGMEAFNDTPLVNGTAYPTHTVQPKSYRLRVLNAANDRFFNLSLYEADASGTEVALNPDEVAAALDDQTIFPTPVAPAGPSWIQIGTEGGFLPTPVVIPPQPTTWVNDPTVFNAGNVDQHSLLLGPAERADVIVDFSKFAGKTLILYNDAPAAFPARDPRYDYYTGNADLRETGGAPATLPGYGPNTRTVMQIKVADAEPATAFDLDALKAAFAHHADGSGVFESSQHPIIVGQGAYNTAYGTSFRHVAPMEGLARISDHSLTFNTLAGTPLSVPLQPKAIQDEQGEAFDHQYGRMSGNLGLEIPNAAALTQNLVLYAYPHPPTEILVDAKTPGVPAADDGTQLWKITHNGVDTHPIHFHLYDVQLVNRVGWDGIIRKPDANELGWKDTVRVSPLEDTIVALRPIVPQVPFELPNSVRLIDPSMPEGAVLVNSTLADQTGRGAMAFDPNGEPVDIVNHFVNFGFEYVWHCHILSHEEMDMMRPVAVAGAPLPPAGLSLAMVGNGGNRRIDVTWLDGSLNETAFTVERATSSAGPWTALATVPSTTGPTKDAALTYSDRVGNTSNTYWYRVLASNTVGDTWNYADPAINEGAAFPTKTVQSEPSPTATLAPAAPSNVAATAAAVSTNAARVTLTWTDDAGTETGFQIQRATNAEFTAGLATSTVGANVTTFTSGNVARGASFYFRVRARNAAGNSDWVNATPFPVVTP
jgi:FtsP/CotA-like multicopper oxidase with cupredoxin domain